MGEFFSGWRRKIGVVTLVTACVLMAGWIRSLRDGDVFCVKISAELYSLRSGGGCVRCGRELQTIEWTAPELGGNNAGLTSDPVFIGRPSFSIEMAPHPYWQTYRSYESSQPMLQVVPVEYLPKLPPAVPL